MADIFAEADDALRRERALKIWNEYKYYFLGFFAALLVLTGANAAYKSWNESVKNKQTAVIIALQSAKDFPENVLKTEKFDLRGNARGILLLNAAGTFIEKKDQKNALALYERISADSGIPADLRDLGTLMAVRLKQNESAKAEDAETLLTRLKPIYNGSGLWAAHARLEAAVITANISGDYAGAREHLNKIQDSKNLPQTLYQKAQFLDHVYSLKQEEAATKKTDEKS